MYNINLDFDNIDIILFNKKLILNKISLKYQNIINK